MESEILIRSILYSCSMSLVPKNYMQEERKENNLYLFTADYNVEAYISEIYRLLLTTPYYLITA